MGDALPAVWAALAFGVGLPIIAYIIPCALGKIDRLLEMGDLSFDSENALHAVPRCKR